MTNVYRIACLGSMLTRASAYRNLYMVGCGDMKRGGIFLAIRRIALLREKIEEVRCQWMNH